MICLISGISGLPRAFIRACSLALVAMPAAAAEWQIMAWNGGPTLEAAVVQFGADGGFSGNTGCNGFRGQARFDGDGLIVDGPVATTRMACPGDAMTLQDDTIIALFAGRIAVTFDPLRDVLRLTNGDTTLELARVPETGSSLPELPETHAGLGRPAGEPPYLNPFGLADDMPIHAAPDGASEVVGGAFSGQVLRNDGCEGNWCRVTTLDTSISGWGELHYLEASDSALRAGQRVFDAVGPVPCAQGMGAPMTDCAMGVARDGGGTATVVVTKPDGIPRVLFFTDGAFVSSDTSEAGGGFESAATRDGDLTRITVDDERYEITDAVIFGG